MGAAAISAAQWSGWHIATKGYFDSYFQLNENKSPGNIPLYGRAFDVDHEELALAALEYDAKISHAKLPNVSATLNLIWGNNAEVLAADEPSGTPRYRMYRQAFLSYTPGKFSVDFGKFDSWIGLEGADSTVQDNYSRSFLYTFGQPRYHFGLRAGYQFTPKINLQLFEVNGWNEVKDSNDEKSFGSKLSFTGFKGLDLSVSTYSGLEASNNPSPDGMYGGVGFLQPGAQHINVTDYVATYRATRKIKFAVDYLLASGETGGVKGVWRGIAGYASFKLPKGMNFSFRAERFEDQDGLRTGVPTNYTSATETLDVPISRTMMWRFEARKDGSDVPAFLDHDGVGFKRTTLTFAQVLRF